MSSPGHSSALAVAVVTGSHPYDVRGFQRLLRSIPGADCYPQHLEDFVQSDQRSRAWDVVLFYMMPEPEPPRQNGGWEARIGPALEALGTTQQGILVLHHAILAYWDWPFWWGSPTATCGASTGTTRVSRCGSTSPTRRTPSRGVWRRGR